MKEVTLANTKLVALVDDEDYERILSIVNYWFINLMGHATGNSLVRKRPILMHRAVLRYRGDLLVDHINRNKLDNRKVNLRLATASQNKANQLKTKGLSSEYKGVSFVKSRQKWQAAIQVNGFSVYGGSFSTEREAALKANELYLKYYGSFAVLNIL